VDWQTAVVVLIEGLAVAFLVQRVVVGRRRKPTKKPDVPVASLVRRDRR
jgi:hypothetical protein